MKNISIPTILSLLLLVYSSPTSSAIRDTQTARYMSVIATSIECITSLTLFTVPWLAQTAANNPKEASFLTKVHRDIAIGFLIATFTSAGEKCLIESKRCRALENLLLTQGYHKTGFAFCTIRRAIAVALTYRLREQLARWSQEHFFAHPFSNEYHNLTVWSSRIFTTLLSIYRNIKAEQNGNDLELITGCQAYWRKWNESISAEARTL